MADSPAHKFGQLIGKFLERALKDPLQKLATAHGMYLDSIRPRKARDDASKISWQDVKGNWHDLDYVLERGGTEEVVGEPKAFIEIAWRRYARHSKNKAQEIQGALQPLLEKYAHIRPFVGVVLAGVFTKPSLNQLRSFGYNVLYCPIAAINEAFARVGIDAAFDESLPDEEFEARAGMVANLDAKQQSQLIDAIRDVMKDELATFIDGIDASFKRTVVAVYITGCYGEVKAHPNVEAAINYVASFDLKAGSSEFLRFEALIRFSNGDELRGNFDKAETAIQFLRGNA